MKTAMMTLLKKIYTKFRAQKEASLPDHPYLAQLEHQKDRKIIAIQEKFQEKLNRVTRDIIELETKLNGAKPGPEVEHQHLFLVFLAVVFDILLNFQLLYSMGLGFGDALLLTIGLSAIQFVFAWFHEKAQLSVVKHLIKFLFAVLAVGMGIMRANSINNLGSLMKYSGVSLIGLYFITFFLSIGQVVLVFWIVRKLREWSLNRAFKRLLSLYKKRKDLQNKLAAKTDETEKIFDELREFYLYQKRLKQNSNNH